MFRRLKNLWRLSEYRVHGIRSHEDGKPVFLVTKDFPTMKKKPATIIPEKVVDVFKDDVETNDP